MNKKELIKQISAKADIPVAKAKKYLDTVLQTITKALTKDELVVLIGFGTFSVKKRAARKGRNPRTGAVIKIPARKVPRFSAGTKLKQAIKQGK